MKTYEILKRKAMNNQEASRYFILCNGDNETPEDLDLYRKGYKNIFGEELSHEKLEKMLLGKTFRKIFKEK